MAQLPEKWRHGNEYCTDSPDDTKQCGNRREVADHWDDLQIQGEVLCRGHVILLQDSPLSELVDLEFILSMPEVKKLPDPAFIFCGATTFLPSAAEEVEKLGLPEMTSHGAGESFRARLIDPVLNRTLEIHFSAVPVGDDFAERDGRGNARRPHH